MGFYRETLHLLLLRLFRVPVVLHVHPSAFSDFYRLGGRFRKFFVRLAFRHSDKAVFLSESTRQEFRELIPGTDSCCLANPVDVGQYQTGGSGNAKTPSHVLFMGWIIREKGVYDLLDAVPLVLEKYPDARFTFAGNKEVERLRNLIESRGLSAVAEVPGWVTGEKRLALLRSATVLVLPSYTEGLPNVILEAMASGLPVIATGVGAIPDVVKHRETGLLVRPGDVAGIASAIHTALADPELRHHMSESALRLVESRYSLEAVSAALTAIYSRYLPARLSRNGHTHHSGNDR